MRSRSCRRTSWPPIRTEHIWRCSIANGIRFRPLGRLSGLPADLEARLTALHEWGYRVLGLAAPLLASDEPSMAARFAEADAQGYLVRDETGEPYAIDVPLGDGVEAALVDLTQPEAVTWWKQLLAEGLA